MASKIADAVSVSVAEQLLSGQGKIAALLSAPSGAPNGHIDGDEVRKHLERVARDSGHVLARSRARELVVGRPGALLARSARAAQAPRRLDELLLARRVKQQKTLPPKVTWGADDWKFVQLRVDRVECISRVKAHKTGEIEGKTDEMYLTGTLIDIGNPGNVVGIDFHLGDFAKGDVNNYGDGDRSRLVKSIDVSGAKTLPTGVIALLVVVEKDYEKKYEEMVTSILEECRDEVVEMIESGDFDGDGEADWNVDEWLVRGLVIAANIVIGLVIHWAKLIARPEVLTLDGSGEASFPFASPEIAAPSDRWAATDHRSAKERLTLKGYGGHYKITLLYRRSKSALT